jgi:hypothetical protein
MLPASAAKTGIALLLNFIKHPLIYLKAPCSTIVEIFEFIDFDEFY